MQKTGEERITFPSDNAHAKNLGQRATAPAAAGCPLDQPRNRQGGRPWIDDRGAAEAYFEEHEPEVAAFRQVRSLRVLLPYSAAAAASDPLSCAADGRRPKLPLHTWFRLFTPGSGTSGMVSGLHCCTGKTAGTVARRSGPVPTHCRTTPRRPVGARWQPLTVVAAGSRRIVENMEYRRADAEWITQWNPGWAKVGLAQHVLLAAACSHHRPHDRLTAVFRQCTMGRDGTRSARSLAG